MFWRIWPALCLLPALSAADLPITEVTLYKHGVAHLERAGELKPGETARLDFKPDDMNDVLKSLAVTDGNGGKVNGVRYDSSDPLEKRLEDFPFRLDAGASLAAFLDQMKGARIELKLGAGDAAGVIISARVVQESDKSQREVLVLLMDSGDIRSFDLGAASAVKLSDPKLQAQLTAYLTVLNQSHARDRRSVYIDAVGSGTRKLTASYMTPAAVWKSSYRLMFGTAGEPTLEGWAIVDNTSGDDWNNVRLAVVSGKPVSFITQLYAPRYVQRPFAELAENLAAAPMVYAGAMEAAKDEADEGNGNGGPGANGIRIWWGIRGRGIQSPGRGAIDFRSDCRHTSSWRVVRVQLRGPGHGEAGRIGDAAVPATEDRRAQAAGVFGKLWPQPAGCGRAYQQHRQDAGWRSDHGLRRWHVCGRGASGDTTDER